MSTENTEQKSNDREVMSDLPDNEGRKGEPFVGEAVVLPYTGGDFGALYDNLCQLILIKR